MRQSIENIPQLMSRQQSGRAAAEVDGIGNVPLCEAGIFSNMSLERRYVVLYLPRSGRMGAKIAVTTLGAAKGNVNVNS